MLSVLCPTIEGREILRDIGDARRCPNVRTRTRRSGRRRYRVAAGAARSDGRALASAQGATCAADPRTSVSRISARIDSLRSAFARRTCDSAGPTVSNRRGPPSPGTRAISSGDGHGARCTEPGPPPGPDFLGARTELRISCTLRQCLRGASSSASPRLATLHQKILGQSFAYTSCSSRLSATRT